MSASLVHINYTANDYRQTTDKLICYFYTQMNQKIGYGKMCYQQAKYIDI